jgi:predicted RNA-binding protein with PIN domain
VSSTAAGADDGDATAGEQGERPVTLVVDAMNVIGSRPDGWWRDRDGALRRLVGRLDRYASVHGQRVVAVADGRAPADLPAGWHGAVRLHFARRAGPDAADDRIVELLDAELETATVVTADADLRERVTSRGHQVLGPGRLLQALDELDAPR